jgi:hypothetical protein
MTNDSSNPTWVTTGHAHTASHSPRDNKELIARHNAKPVVVTRTKAPLRANVKVQRHISQQSLKSVH